MKKILPLFLTMLIFGNFPSNATPNILQKEQAYYLINQVRLLTLQGKSPEDIVKIFEQSLMNEKSCSSSCEHDSNTLIECLIFMALGAGITYLIMDQKLKEEKAKNPVHVIRQIFR
jgi:hypothetical protein